MLNLMNYNKSTRVVSPQKHKGLHQIISQSLETEIQSLSPTLQSALIDDLVTAFQNRFNILKKIQTK